MNIIDVQSELISRIIAIGYSNVKDSLLYGITETETYPVVVVDIDSSMSHDVSTGSFVPFVHYITISCYQKASIGIAEARASAISALENILSNINETVVENNIQYIDTVMNNIRVCGAGCIIEISAY